MAEKILGGSWLLEAREPGELFFPEDFSDEHKMIAKTTKDFVEGEIHPVVDDIDDQKEGVALGILAQAGELGLLATDVPEAYGGMELDKISTTIVAEYVGQAGSWAVCHGAHTGIGTLPIVYYGTEEQKQKYLPRLASGEWCAAYCLTEPGAGSDATNAATKAVLSEDGKHYILNGEKIFITNAGWADTFIVYAKVDGEAFTAFIVEKGFPGVSTGPEEKKMGIKGSSTRPVILEDAMVPVENVLHEIGQGHKVAFNILNIGRYKLGAAAMGGCKKVLAESTGYAAERQQFNRPIIQFGMIREKLARMAMKTYLSEAMVYRTAGLIDSLYEAMDKSPDAGLKAIEEYAVECSINKVYVSEAVDYCVDEGVQIHGGYGYIADYPIERAYRDARINRIFEGTNEVNRLLVPGTILRRAMKGQLPLMQAAQETAAMVLEFSPLMVEIPDEPLGFQSHMIEMTRRAVLLVAGAAAQKYMQKLADEQEILARIADMAIELYAMESGLLRAKKKIAAKGEEAAAFDVAVVEAYMDETLPKIQAWGNEVLAAMDEGDSLRTNMMALRKFTKNQPIDAVARRRFIADLVEKKGGYPPDY